jgi:PAS domain-containing protein
VGPVFFGVLQQDGRQICDLHLIRTDDTIFPARFEGVRAEKSDGSYQIRLVVSDVTALIQKDLDLLKKTEELEISEEVLKNQYTIIASAEADLRQTKEILENLISIANVPIIIWDPSFHITRFNHAFELLTGRSADEIVGKSLDLLFPPDQAERSMRLFKTTLEFL